MKALSIRQPWAWLIVKGYKDIENRTWRTNYRGPVLIHASAAKPSKEDMTTAANILFKLCGWSRHLPDRDSFYRGGIVGVATVTDCVSESTSPWFFGPAGFQLADAQELPFRPMKGRLSFFETHQRPHKAFSLLVPEEYQDATELGGSDASK
ncbi:ASCH domain [Serratia quinivorans]|uniref:ASCH domain-containing protein n=1 Tax=Serratia quinivorans TaxID=137545 RepID=UPI0021778DCE|nr:ASCH domain-containing protein [Serratia quinivorans]CAI1622745.1 ASCH domain [Serratia quinivorans]CAI2395335.1 ASCH domain [Serratia quinivorans]